MWQLCRQEGNYNEIRQILTTKRIGINFIDPLDGLAAIHKICRFEKDFEKLLQLFVEFGADVNCQTMNGATPLHLALGHKTNAVEILLKFNVDCNIVNSLNATHLMLASMSWDEKCVSEIFKRTSPAVVQQKDKTGWTALHYAVHGNGRAEVFKILSQHIDTNIVDNQGYRAIDHCPGWNEDYAHPLKLYQHVI